MKFCYNKIHLGNKLIMLISLFGFHIIPGKAQIISLKGSYITLLSGTVIGTDSIYTDGAATFSNAGILNLSSINNAGSLLGNGAYNISRNFFNSGTFSAGTSTVNYNGTTAQIVAPITYFNLTATGSSTKTAGGAITVNGTLNLAAVSTLDLATSALSGSLATITGTGIIKTQNVSSTPVPAGKTWTGIFQYNSSGAQTIVTGNYLDLNTTGGNRTLLSGTTGIAGIFTPGSGTFTVTGSTVDFNGTGTQNIPAFSFNNISVSGGTIKTLTADINLTNTLTLAANTTLALGANNITLKSSSTATARVAALPVTASVTYGTGKFISQRYIMGRRKYRLITSSVTTSTGSTLTTGQESLSIWGNWQNQGGSIANVGTIITGGNSADGYDQQTSNASLYTYNFSGRLYTGFTSANGKNTKYTPLKAGVAYYMFVYGDRTNTIYTATPNYTTLSSSGTILTGDQTYTTSSAIPLNGGSGIYTLLGNPFASPIDWATLPRTNLSNTYWGWDPNLSSTGGYVTVSTAGSVTLISPFSGTTGLNQYIQSGQGFFVQATAAAPSLTIREQDKVSNYNANAFRTLSPNSIPLIAVNLLYDNAGGQTLADGALAAFDANFSNSVTNEDASKIMNIAENVSLLEGTSLLSIDERQMPKQNDTLFLNITKLTKPQYTLQIFSNQLNGLAKAYLEDKYLKTYLPLSLIDTNRITVNISSDPASFNANRFRIVFDQPSTGILTIPNNNVKPEIKVFPNPITDRQINFQVTGIEKGDYNFNLHNSIGQQIFTATFNYDGTAAKQNILLTKKLPAGIYYLQITNKTKSFSKTIWAQ
jgi:hypothetical protein